MNHPRKERKNKYMRNPAGKTEIVLIYCSHLRDIQMLHANMFLSLLSIFILKLLTFTAIRTAVTSCCLIFKKFLISTTESPYIAAHVDPTLPLITKA